MKGMIFAAGIGSRLKPWTDSHPKALVEVGSRPVLGRVIDRMFEAGIESIVINVHHFADQIVDYLALAYPDAPITVSDERVRLLETGGGLFKALPMLAGGDDVLIHNADIVSNMDLRAMIRSHRESGNDATLLVQPRNTSRHILFRNGLMAGWCNSTTGEVRPATLVDYASFMPMAFGGVHIVSHSVLDALSRYGIADEPFSIIDFYIDNCNKLNIGAFELPADAHWFDIGKPETLEAARSFFL